MSPRRYKLRIHVSEPEIFYHWNYDPPVRNCGGGAGYVNPGGTMHGISYDVLKSLGEGEHAVEFDETVRSKHGRLPPTWTNDDVLFRLVRGKLFAETVGACVAGDPFCTILMAMTPRNVTRILPLLSDSHVGQLKRYAAQIADNLEERDKRDHSILSSSGTSTRIPDENLETIRRHFGCNREGGP
jgi:hypothetical protein